MMLSKPRNRLRNLTLIVLCAICYVFQLRTSDQAAFASPIFQVEQECPEGNRDIATVAFSPDGKYVLASWDEGTARLWETSTGKILYTLQHGSDYVTSVSFSRDGKYIVTAGGKEAVLWDTQTGTKIRTFAHDKNEWLTNGVHAQLLPDNKYLLTSVAQELILWDVESGKKIYVVPDRLNAARRINFELSLDGKYLLIPNSWDLSVPKAWELRDTLTGNKLQTFDVLWAMFWPDSKHIVTSGKEVKLWDITTKEPVFDFAPSGYAEIFSPDGSYLYVAGIQRNQTPKIYSEEIWDTAKLQKKLNLSFFYIWSVAFSPDSKYLYVIETTTHGYFFYKWDIQTARRIEEHPTNMYVEGITEIMISPDYKYILARGAGLGFPFLQLWDLQGNKKLHSFC